MGSNNVIFSYRKTAFAVLLLFNVLVCIQADYYDTLLNELNSVFTICEKTYSELKWSFYGVCDYPHQKTGFGLESSLRNKLHGQHLVQDIVMKYIDIHIRNKNPTKALVLSFHGWTGTGKNFASKLIADHLYENGMNSKFVKLFIASYHFPLDDKYHIEKYKMNIQRTIKNIVNKCPSALFIFDEIDKIPNGVIDAIKPFIDYHESVDDVDYRKSMFIFLSNAGGSSISEETFRFWQAGVREEITLKDLEEVIKISAFNEDGGMKGIDVIGKNLVTAFVPFLPLERKHVKLCIKDELVRRHIGVNDKIIDKIADQLEYYPEKEKTYSKTGCKRISEKVDLEIYQEL